MPYLSFSPERSYFDYLKHGAGFTSCPKLKAALPNSKSKNETTHPIAFLQIFDHIIICAKLKKKKPERKHF